MRIYIFIIFNLLLATVKSAPVHISRYDLGAEETTTAVPVESRSPSKATVAAAAAAPCAILLLGILATIVCYIRSQRSSVDHPQDIERQSQRSSEDHPQDVECQSQRSSEVHPQDIECQSQRSSEAHTQDVDCQSHRSGTINGEYNRTSIETEGEATSDNKSIKAAGEEMKLEGLEKEVKVMENCRAVKKSGSSLELKAPEELSRSTASQSSSCHEEKFIKSGTSSVEADKSTSPGTVPLSLESFTFHRILGSGGFGQVFLATDLIRRERVAIKVSDKTVFTNRGQSFGERHVLKDSHKSPYLIHGLAAFHTPNCVYYVMELATGGSLNDLIQKHHPLDPATVKFIAAEVVCGTEFLHRNGILHRDLKLRNIVLTKEGHIKIIDFGCAVTGVFKRTKGGCGIGTPGYAAPEVVQGQAHGRGVDFFAIGVILYKLFTKKTAFPGMLPQLVEWSVLNYTPDYPDELAPETINIMEGLLCKDPFQRLGVKGDIRKHPFFSDINWKDVEARRMAPPAILTADSVDLNVEETVDYAEQPSMIKSEDQKIFDRFSFVCPEWSKQYHPVIKPKNWKAKLFTKRPFRKSGN